LFFIEQILPFTEETWIRDPGCQGGANGTSTKELPEVLRWGGWRNPNPPDPWLELILEIGDPQIRQAAVSELVKMNIATARIQGEFWTGIQRAMGAKG
jgi:hypothetical protein